MTNSSDGLCARCSTSFENLKYHIRIKHQAKTTFRDKEGKLLTIERENNGQFMCLGCQRKYEDPSKIKVSITTLLSSNLTLNIAFRVT